MTSLNKKISAKFGLDIRVKLMNSTFSYESSYTRPIFEVFYNPFNGIVIIKGEPDNKEEERRIFRELSCKIEQDDYYSFARYINHKSSTT